MLAYDGIDGPLPTSTFAHFHFCVTFLVIASYISQYFQLRLAPFFICQSVSCLSTNLTLKQTHPHQNTTPKQHTFIMSEGGQSPPPERQSGAQQNDTPASGKGTDKSESKDQIKESLNVSSLHYLLGRWKTETDDDSRTSSQTPHRPRPRS